MAEFDVARLLQSPLGQVAPPGVRGDMVRVSDGRVRVYLDPDEFDRATEDDLRALLLAARGEAKAARDARSEREAAAREARAAQGPESPAPRISATAGSATRRRSSQPPSVTAPRRVGRPAERLW